MNETERYNHAMLTQRYNLESLLYPSTHIAPEVRSQWKEWVERVAAKSGENQSLAFEVLTLKFPQGGIQ